MSTSTFRIGDHVEYTPDEGPMVRGKVVRVEEGGKYALFLPGKGEIVVGGSQLAAFAKPVEKSGGEPSALFGVGDHVEYMSDEGPMVRGKVVRAEEGGKYVLFLPGKGEIVVGGSQLAAFDTPVEK
jgi:hypothetical protein